METDANFGKECDKAAQRENRREMVKREDGVTIPIDIKGGEPVKVADGPNVAVGHRM
jgi:hypothetical protein